VAEHGSEAAELDSDLYRPYHPAHDALTQRDDTLMAGYLGPDAWAWLAQAALG
jgi:hypothetical protein